MGRANWTVDRGGLAADAQLALTDGHLVKTAELFTEALGLWHSKKFGVAPGRELRDALAAVQRARQPSRRRAFGPRRARLRPAHD